MEGTLVLNGKFIPYCEKPNGSLRICLDPTDLNKEIVRPVCNSQTMDDVIEKLKDAKYFAVF